jgi:DNA-binding response OmpR family regulator
MSKADAPSIPNTARPPITTRRVLIVDGNKSKYMELMNALREAGIEVMHINERAKILPTADNFRPDLILINLFLDNASNLGAVRDLRKMFEKQGTKILVITAHHSKENIMECIKAGATDFILDPFDPRLLLQRVKYQLQDRDFYMPEDLRAEPTQLQAGFQLVYDCLRILAEIKDPQRALHETLKLVGEMSQASRVNIILADVETNDARVLASSDDPKVQNLKVDLEKYPEVREVVINGSIVYVKDITQNPLTKDIANQVKTIDIASLIVFPIRHRGETLGTLNVRIGKAGFAVSDKHLKTFYMAALCLGSKVAAKRLLARAQSGAPA